MLISSYSSLFVWQVRYCHFSFLQLLGFIAAPCVSAGYPPEDSGEEKKDEWNKDDSWNTNLGREASRSTERGGFWSDLFSTGDGSGVFGVFRDPR